MDTENINRIITAIKSILITLNPDSDSIIHEDRFIKPINDTLFQIESFLSYKGDNADVMNTVKIYTKLALINTDRMIDRCRTDIFSIKCQNIKCHSMIIYDKISKLRESVRCIENDLFFPLYR